MPRSYPAIGIQVPSFYLPRPGIDLQRWAVIACDQFTSQPEYWAQVENFVAGAPSTLNLTLPEVYLEKPGLEDRIQHIQRSMRAYLQEGILEPHEGLVYVERTVDGRTRRGLVLCLDLEQYDYHKGASSLVRSTEGTIVERLPPRIKIRSGAPLELPHILVLIDDPACTVIDPLGQAKSRLNKLYDFDLMFDSGHLQGYLVEDPTLEAQVVQALNALAQPEFFAQKYGVGPEQSVLLFAMGDGNHSLATAKAIWEQVKLQVGPDHPSRYALVEIENVHDRGLEFEPIHRLLFGVKQDPLQALQAAFGEGYSFQPCPSEKEMVRLVDEAGGAPQKVGLVSPQALGVIRIANPTSNLPVGTLQTFLDDFLKKGGAEKIDYVHGQEVVCQLSARPGCAGFYLPGMDKSDLFKTVILDGALPRKTFSMGEAREKRFYMESRKITA